MTRICVLSHSPQHSAQIRASMSAPSEPGSPTFPAPSRSCPHRAHMTTAMRSCYKRRSPKPADSADRAVAEDRTAKHVRKGNGTECPAIGALLGAVAEHRARVVGHSGDPLQHQPVGISGVPNEHDFPNSGPARELRNQDPVARAERGFHAPARHRDAPQHRYARAATAFWTRVAWGPPAFVQMSAILSIMSRRVLASPRSSEPLTFEHCLAAFQQRSVISGYFWTCSGLK